MRRWCASLARCRCSARRARAGHDLRARASRAKTCSGVRPSGALRGRGRQGPKRRPSGCLEHAPARTAGVRAPRQPRVSAGRGPIRHFLLRALRPLPDRHPRAHRGGPAGLARNPTKGALLALVISITASVPPDPCLGIGIPSPTPSPAPGREHSDAGGRRTACPNDKGGMFILAITMRCCRRRTSA